MLSIVRLSLARPLTFVVMAILITIFGVLAAVRTPTDIFPNIGIPVISVVWTYNGLPPDDMAGRVIAPYERSVSTTVNDIAHIESQSYTTYGVVKITFQPSVDINAAQAQVTAISQTMLKQLPAGMNPPQILVYNASSVPLIQIALSSDTLSQTRLNDLAANFIRPQLVNVPGAQMPSPYGGSSREVQVDLDEKALRAHGLSAQDVVDALARQNLITPVGTQKIGVFEYTVDLVDSPKKVADFNDVPVKVVNGAVVFMRDVAYVHDGAPPQTNVAQIDGRKGVLISVVKNGSASTLDVIDGVKKALPTIEAGLPPGVRLELVNDQSGFVKASVANVLREGAIAASLTGLMILLFLGSWRSTLIIATTIPLAILSALIFLSLRGQTINVMTLGGLALAVGILVDDATVTIENVNRHLENGEGLDVAILSGAREIMPPATVSLLCICAAFAPLLALGGVAGFLFRPLAEAVAAAMIASYVLTYTLVPTMARALLHAHAGHDLDAKVGAFTKLQRKFEARFDALCAAYVRLLSAILTRRGLFAACFFAFCAASLALLPALGENFFPRVDAGAIKIHMRAPPGSRIETTSAIVDQVEAKIRETLPPGRVAGVVSNIGLPNSGINLSYGSSGTIGVSDADIWVSLTDGEPPAKEFEGLLRRKLNGAFPGVSFAFLPADMVSQILSFGQPAQIDVQIAGFDQQADRAFAAKLLAAIRRTPGVADARLQQEFRAPALRVDVDRDLAGVVGLTERDAATSLQTTLSGSAQSTPSFWLNPRNGVSYPISVQAPQYDIDSTQKLSNVLLSNGGSTQLLGALAKVTPEAHDEVVTHYDIRPTIDIYASAAGRPLGAVAGDVEAVIQSMRADLPKGATVAVRGQAAAMQDAYAQLAVGLGFSILLIYLLMVVNFQSWLDPFIIILALPAALAGIAWMLFVTGTTLSAPALTGAIMCMGVATANSILVINFARSELAAGKDAASAALAAGATRFRPVMMTALAMIIGMAPTALEPGQNMPLGRAVIGGLAFATFATLLLGPALFALLHRARPAGASFLASSGDPMPTLRPASRQSSRRAAIAAGCVLAAAAGLVASGLVSRARSEQEAARTTLDLATPRVRLVRPADAPKDAELVLPGDAAALNAGSIYARASGYVAAWNKDIGAHVKKGDVLATIESPELDQQLAQARADLTRAEADVQLAEVTAQRWKSLAQRAIVSQQANDEKSADLAAKRAAETAAKANVARLESLASFENLEAPFDGVVTARNVEIGDLVDSGSKAGKPLFKVSDLSRMRIYVRAPQAYLKSLTPGLKATLELPGRRERFKATLVSTSNAVAEASRTALVELSAPNPDGKLWPGAFVEVHFQIPGDADALRLPASALIFDDKGLSVATVDANDRVEIKPVAIDRNLGPEIEIKSGLTRADRVVDNPSETLASGDLVRPVGEETASAQDARATPATP
ncbi:efflux RND transporter permease subunit [Methylocella sp.]|uniref:efflux RND transporter permease subunit n=1 Tax=Methylocella sp. TaxID=1978226 RepID=UPI003784549D